MLTAREAFLAMARAWDEAECAGNFHWFAMIRGIQVDGLCIAAKLLAWRGLIWRETSDEMLNLMKRNRPAEKDANNFWWGHTREDAAARAAFCRRMAELCDEPVTADLGAGI